MRYIREMEGTADIPEKDAAKVKTKGSLPGLASFLFESEHNHILINNGLVAQEEAIGLSSIPDNQIIQNRHFSYPVMFNKGNGKIEGLTILLHGLNEKTWNKYWSWGKYLLEKTGQPVLFFPLSFHMDRAPIDWSDRHKMAALIGHRKKNENNSSISFANLAISERLENVPERFVLSGYQSIMDIVKLVKQIRQGKHPMFSPDLDINFFGYSIGAFVSQVIALADPEGLFSSSKFFLFCGGSVFSEIKGTSKYIIDGAAFRKLNDFYSDEGLMNASHLDTFHEVLDSEPVGKAFRAMLYPGQLEEFRLKKFKEMNSRLKVVGLSKDKVFSFNTIVSSIAGRDNYSENIEVLDYHYRYTHENPFPAPLMNSSKEARECYHHVFNSAVNHFQEKEIFAL